MPVEQISRNILLLLWQISWQSAVVIGLVLVVRFAFGWTLTPRCRHALWTLVLLRLLLPAFPASRFSLFGWGRNHATISAVVIPPQSEQKPTIRIIRYPLVTPVKTIPKSELPVVEPVKTDWSTGLVCCWLAVVLLLIGRTIRTQLKFAALVHRTAAPAASAVSILSDCCRHMNVRRAPGLFYTDAVASPALAGLFRPAILLPPSVGDLPDESLRLVLLHELTHLKGVDIAVEYFWAFARAVHWFNPIVYFIGPLRRADREVLRDSQVLQVLESDDRENYGRMLLQLARPSFMPAFCPGLVGLGGREIFFKRRIKMVSSFHNRSVRSTVIGSAVVGLTAVLALTGRPTNAQTTVPVETKQAVRTVRVTTPAAAPADPTRDPITAKLDTLKITLDIHDKSFESVVEQFRGLTDASIYVDWKALETAGIKRDATVSMKLRDIKTSKALEILLKAVETDDNPLGYVVDEGVITITTKHELDKNTVTRRYDINDLLFVAPDYSNAPDLSLNNAPQGQVPASTPPVKNERAERIDELKKYITDNVDTNSWKDNGGDVGSISSSPLRAILLITQTPGNQAKIASVLDSLREGQGLQVSVETRFVLLDDDQLDKLPKDLAKQLRDPDVKTVAGRSTDAAAIRQFQAMSGVKSTTAPRLTLFSGQRAVLEVQTSQTYTKAWSPVVNTKEGTTTYQPVTDTFNNQGMVLSVLATISPDRKSVMVNLQPQVILYSGLVTEPWKAGPADLKLSIQRPVSLVSKTDVSGTIPDGTMMLFDCGGFTQSESATTQPTNDPEIIQKTEKAKHTRMFMLVKPTILQVKPVPQTPAGH